MESLTFARECLRDDYRVGGWLVQPALNRLTNGATTLRVRPQLMDVLVCLSRHPGRVVSRKQLLAEVWPDRSVSESGVSRCIAELRRLLGDRPQQPSYIETITKRGYRLVAPAEPAATRTRGHAACVGAEAMVPALVGRTASPDPAPSPPRRWLQLVACALAAAVSNTSKS